MIVIDDLLPGLDDPKIRKMIEKNQPLIDAYSQKHPLVSVAVTMENGRPEPVYAFNDEMGYYTIEGVKKSLDEIKSYAAPPS